MRALGAAELLELWERCDGRGPGELALTLAAAACPELPAGAALDLPLGARDLAILELRERTLGPRLEARAACPACGEQVELGLTVADLRVGPPLADEVEVVCGPATVRARPPTTRDLLAARAADDPRAALLERCVIDGPLALDDGAVAAIEAALAACDPQADLTLTLTCPACEHGWAVGLDIATYFARQLDTWAARVLDEIHMLAGAYGWTEPEALRLSPRRRRLYIARIAG